METTDYLNMKTTNINVRISPLMKSSLIEEGATIGLNLSDYILHILTKEMSGQHDEASRIAELKSENEGLEMEVKQYEDLAEPFKDAVGNTMEVNGQSHLIEEPYDVLWVMAQSFKIRE